MVRVNLPHLETPSQLHLSGLYEASKSKQRCETDTVIEKTTLKLILLELGGEVLL